MASSQIGSEMQDDKPVSYRQRIDMLRRLASRSKYPEEAMLFTQLAEFYERQILAKTARGEPQNSN